ncbi:MAG: Rrf2 family transcriptional regulator [Coriobacteriales bacterium]|jgi:Rrf2 family protein|nr:Rrf2 family transcriptional regulator [Coriobacteriales bacterium]
MRASSKARYALYLMIDVAQHQEQRPVPLREVSIRQNISLKYLEQIASLLSKVGYLESMRGAQGGYRLAQDAASISAGDIMRAAEGDFVSVACLDQEAAVCPRNSSCCSISAFWQGLHETIDTYTDKVSLEELASR